MKNIFWKINKLALVVSLLTISYSSIGSECNNTATQSNEEKLVDPFVPSNCFKDSFDSENSDGKVCKCASDNINKDYSKIPKFKKQLEDYQKHIKENNGKILINSELEKIKTGNIALADSISDAEDLGIAPIASCNLQVQMKNIIDKCSKNPNAVVHGEFRDELEKFLVQRDYDNSSKFKGYTPSNKGFIDTTERKAPICSITGAMTREIRTKRDEKRFVDFLGDIDLSKFDDVQAKTGKEFLENRKLYKRKSNTQRKFRAILKDAKKNSAYDYLLKKPELLKQLAKKIQKSDKPENNANILQNFMRKNIASELAKELENKCQHYFDSVKQLMCADSTLPVVSESNKKLADRVLAFEKDDLIKDKKITDPDNMIEISVFYNEMCTIKKDIRKSRKQTNEAGLTLYDDFFDIDKVDFSKALPSKYQDDQKRAALDSESLVNDTFVRNQESIRDNICEWVPDKLTQGLKTNNCDNPKKSQSDVCIDLSSYLTMTISKDGVPIDKKIAEIKARGDSKALERLLEGLNSMIKKEDKPFSSSFSKYTPIPRKKSDDVKKPDNKDNPPGTPERDDQPVKDGADGKDGKDGKNGERKIIIKTVKETRYVPVEVPTYENQNRQLRKLIGKQTKLIGSVVDQNTSLFNSMRNSNKKFTERLNRLQDELDAKNSESNNSATDEDRPSSNYVERPQLGSTVNNSEILTAPILDTQATVIPTEVKEEDTEEESTDKDKARLSTEDSSSNSILASKLEQIQAKEIQEPKQKFSESKFLEVADTASNGPRVIKVTGEMAHNIFDFDFDKIHKNSSDKDHEDLLKFSRVLKTGDDFILKIDSDTSVHSFRVSPSGKTFKVELDESKSSNKDYKKAYDRIQKAIKNNKFEDIRNYSKGSLGNLYEATDEMVKELE